MFQALAIKYRPKTFSELIGQDAVSQTLSLALDSKRLGHAYLFSGLRGSGKTSSARIFARSLNCEKGPTSTPCGDCENCRAAENNRHLDIVEMDAASSRKIDDIRDLIEQTRYAPALGRYKIFIIDEVHMLTKESYNALLKTLEEPPSYVKFILATTDVLNIPPTILSRTQHFRFKKIPAKTVVAHLETILSLEDIPSNIDSLEMLARSGNGSLRDTLTLLDQAIIYSKGNLDPTLIAQMLGIVDPKLLDNFFDTLLQQDKEALLKIVETLESYECEMVLEEMGLYLKNVLIDSSSRIPIAMIDRFFRILTDSRQLLFLNANSSFVLVLTCLKMLEAFKIKQIESRIVELENELLSLPKPMTLDTPQDIDSTMQHTSEPINEQSDEHARELFKKLIDVLYDRSIELGECFENNVTFVGFDNGQLLCQSNAQGACKERLRLAYNFIRENVKKLYGVSARIVPVKANDVRDTNPIAKPIQTKTHLISIPHSSVPHETKDTTSAETQTSKAQTIDNESSNTIETQTHDSREIKYTFPRNIEELINEIPVVGDINNILGIEHIDSKMLENHK